MAVVRCGPVHVRLSGAPDRLVERLRATFFWEVRGDDDPAGTGERPWSVSLRDAGPGGPDPDAAVDTVPYEFDEKAVVLREEPLTLWIPRTGGWIELSPRDRSVTITNADPRGLFVDTYRTVRQLVVSELTGQGYVCIHASCVTSGGHGFAFVGDKGAGKTTLMTALAARGFAVVSNDKLFVRPDGAACHFPEAPGATVKTLTALPDWRRRLDRARDQPEPAASLFLDHPALPTADEVVGSPDLHKVFFSEREYLRFLGTTGDTGTTLRMVFEIDPVRGDEARIDPTVRVPLARHREDLVPFPDWTRTRATPNPGSLRHIRTARLRPASGIAATVAAVHEFVTGVLTD